MGVEQKLGDMGIVTTKLEELVNWSRTNAMWPMLFGLACCAIEMMAAQASHYDMSRFGMELMRASPRQSDLMIVAGRVSRKMAPVVRRLYDQMPEPKWCISMGACASTGGIFDTYAVVQGIDRFIPVDVYIPGCPPRPDQILRAILDMQNKVQKGGRLFGTALPSQEERDRQLVQIEAKASAVRALERGDESRFGYRLPGGEAAIGERRQ